MRNFGKAQRPAEMAGHSIGTQQRIRGVVDQITDEGEQGHVDLRDPYLTKTQEEVEATTQAEIDANLALLNQPMPTHDEWAKASGQMAQQTNASPFTRLRSSIRHRWASWLGERRHQLRAWLGITALDELDGVRNEDIRQLKWITEGLRADLDATNAEIHKRLEIDEKNVAEFVRQFHVLSRGVESHANVINGLLTDLKLQKMVRTHMARLKDKAKRAAERDAVPMREMATTEPTGGEEALEAELEQESSDVIPMRHLMPEASDPGDHPQAD